MSVNLFIWGIRKGFMPKGMYNSYSDNPHDLDAVPSDIRAIELIQSDAFRPAFITRTAGTSSFMIHRTSEHTVVSFIYTSIKEFAAGNRDGYVVFSMIIPKNYSFESSPRKTLNDLANFYKSRAEKSAQNNFRKEEINSYLEKVRLIPAAIKSVPSSHFYNYKNVKELDEILKCDLPYFCFNELILVYGSIDFASLGLERKLRATLGLQSYSIKPADYNTLRLEFESEQRKKLEADKRETVLRNKASEVSNRILLAINNGNKDAAIIEYEQFTYKDYFGSRVKQEIEKIKVAKEKAAKQASLDASNLMKKDEIIRRIDNGDLKKASDIYEDLSHKNILDSNYRGKLENYKKGLEKQEHAQREENRRKRNLIISFSSLFTVTSFVLLYIFVFNINPSNDGSNQATKEVVLEDSEDEGPVRSSPMTQCDSLTAGLEVHIGAVPDNSKLNNARVKYEKETGWHFISTEGEDHKWNKVSKSVSIDILEEKFPCDMKSNDHADSIKKNPEEDKKAGTEAGTEEKVNTTPIITSEKNPCDDFSACKSDQDSLFSLKSSKKKDKPLYEQYKSNYKTLNDSGCSELSKPAFKAHHKSIVSYYDRLR